jgi:hypothetical protein
MSQQINQPVYWEVLNPESEYETSEQTIAPRLPGLQGKKIGLFWNGKPNGDILLNAIEKALEERLKVTDFHRFNLCIGVGPENIKRMAQQCDGVISALGD